MTVRRVQTKQHPRWVVGVFGLRVYEARGAMTACMRHAQQHGLPTEGLEEIMELLSREADRARRLRQEGT